MITMMYKRQLPKESSYRPRIPISPAPPRQLQPLSPALILHLRHMHSSLVFHGTTWLLMILFPISVSGKSVALCSKQGYCFRKEDHLRDKEWLVEKAVERVMALGEMQTAEFCSGGVLDKQG